MMDNRGTGTFVTDETELTTGSLDLYTVPSTEKVLEEGKTIEVNTVSALTNTGPYEFRICRDPDNYLALNQTKLCGTVRVLQNDNSEVPANGSLSIPNLFPQTLFGQVEFYVEGVNVNDAGTATYPIKAFLETLFSYDEGAKKTHLVMAGWHQDTAGHEHDVPLLSAESTKTANLAFTERISHIAGKDYHFNMILHVDFLQSQRYLIPNTEILIKLHRNPDTYSLMAPSMNNKIVFKDLKLHIRKIKLEKILVTAILNKLPNEPD